MCVDPSCSVGQLGLFIKLYTLCRNFLDDGALKPNLLGSPRTGYRDVYFKPSCTKLSHKLHSVSIKASHKSDIESHFESSTKSYGVFSCLNTRKRLTQTFIFVQEEDDIINEVLHKLTHGLTNIKPRASL